MRERPILFSTEMVKAILAGRKTMTRRIVKPQPVIGDERYTPSRTGGVAYRKAWIWIKSIHWDLYEKPSEHLFRFCPYGQVGDRLWVRETFAPSQMMSGKTEITYKADGGNPPSYLMADGKEIPCYWKPSIFMPRWASRITLEITNIRAEQLQETTEADAVREGFSKLIYFLNYWDKLNMNRGYAQELNPWVWVIEFKRLEANNVSA